MSNICVGGIWVVSSTQFVVEIVHMFFKTHTHSVKLSSVSVSKSTTNISFMLLAWFWDSCVRSGGMEGMFGVILLCVTWFHSS